MNEARPRPEIIVLAGTNGAGKSSIGGEALRESGGDYYNPDEAARDRLRASPGLSVREANSRAWQQGRDLLGRAIEQRLRFAFETTLGGTSITGLLIHAANVGLPVRMWYVGLRDADLHIQRVRARVARGGHDIPEQTIRQRYNHSRLNLIRLLPHLAELKLYDNSLELDPHRGEQPVPLLILHLKRGAILDSCPPHAVPEWAKPIVQATWNLFGLWPRA